jgi:hypothetical protein
MQKLYRDLCIIACISEMERNGYGPVSKSCTDSSTISLCDVIAEVMSSLGFKGLGYEGIRSILEKRKTLEPLIKTFLIAMTDNGLIHIGYKPHK